MLTTCSYRETPTFSRGARPALPRRRRISGIPGKHAIYLEVRGRSNTVEKIPGVALRAGVSSETRKKQPLGESSPTLTKIHRAFAFIFSYSIFPGASVQGAGSSITIKLHIVRTSLSSWVEHSHLNWERPARNSDGRAIPEVLREEVSLNSRQERTKEVNSIRCMACNTLGIPWLLPKLPYLFAPSI